MKDRKTIFDFLGQVFGVYGVTMSILIIFCLIFGESAKDLSSMFTLGNKGLTVETMLQFLLVSFLSTGTGYLYFTETFFKKASAALRATLMVVTIISILIVFIFVCGWFPVKLWQPWVMFFICFGVSFIISMDIMYLKVKADNKNMEEALKKFKEEMNN